MKRGKKAGAMRARKSGMKPANMAGNKSVSKPAAKFFDVVSSVKPGPDVKARKPLTSAAKRRLANQPI